uniref:Uncharacterized protein n=1 Tax=Nelumbo nucifera TaxID=4432 RepID=A0A822XDI3_NELNU|nr:TPA_asm: hypothetical protein HUJ06_019710 [Nelumbo nucifera]
MTTSAILSGFRGHRMDCHTTSCFIFCQSTIAATATIFDLRKDLYGVAKKDGKIISGAQIRSCGLKNLQGVCMEATVAWSGGWTHFFSLT